MTSTRGVPKTSVLPIERRLFFDYVPLTDRDAIHNAERNASIARAIVEEIRGPCRVDEFLADRFTYKALVHAENVDHATLDAVKKRFGGASSVSFSEITNRDTDKKELWVVVEKSYARRFCMPEWAFWSFVLVCLAACGANAWVWWYANAA